MKVNNKSMSNLICCCNKEQKKKTLLCSYNMLHYNCWYLSNRLNNNSIELILETVYKLD